MSKHIIVKNVDNKITGVLIAEGIKHKFIFYFTKGKDIMLLTRNDNLIEVAWGFSSIYASMRRHVEMLPSKNAQSFCGSIKNIAVSRAINKGRTVYTADTMHEVLEIYKEVA